MSTVTKTAINFYTFYRRYTGSEGWASQRDNPIASGSVDTTAEPRGRAARQDTGISYEIDRSTFTFDTTDIPSNAVISSVVFNWYRKNEVHENNNPDLYIVPVSATGTDLDFYNQTYFGTSVGTIINTQSLGNNTVVNQWANVSLTTSCIVKEGTTILGVRIGNDYNNDAPQTAAKQNIMYGDNEANKPYLTIVYTTPATVTTGVATALQPISATLAGNVTNAGGGTVSQRGVCWSMSANPTTSDPKATSAGSTGAYTVSATGLLPGTLYHYRSYVITENSTQYGADVTFRTPGGAILFELL